ncbi:MAG: HEAT repeat domain-containing protein, partial [Cyanobacteriota bacterium]|nr:HEAT repeat domain-containing protein [Cyanobacteriota bacterium]
ELLEQALSADIGPSVRRAAARGLGQLRCTALTAEERRPIRQRALTALEAAGEDGEWVVRYAVVVGLESLGLALAREDGALPAGRALLDRSRRALHLRSTAAETTPVVQLRAIRALALLPDPAAS